MYILFISNGTLLLLFNNLFFNWYLNNIYFYFFTCCLYLITSKIIICCIMCYTWFIGKGVYRIYCDTVVWPFVRMNIDYLYIIWLLRVRSTRGTKGTLVFVSFGIVLMIFHAPGVCRRDTYKIVVGCNTAPSFIARVQIVYIIIDDLHFLSSGKIIIIIVEHPHPSSLCVSTHTHTHTTLDRTKRQTERRRCVSVIHLCIIAWLKVLRTQPTLLTTVLLE